MARDRAETWKSTALASTFAIGFQAEGRILKTFSKGEPQISLAYTDFIAQAGNVTHVQIVGDQITGSFAKPYTPPSTPTPGAQPAPAPSSQSYTAFHTTLPEAVDDPQLLPLLESKGVGVDAQSPSTPWFITLLTDGLPLLLLLGFFILMGRQAAQQQSGIFGFGRSRVRDLFEQAKAAAQFQASGLMHELERTQQLVASLAV